MSKDLKAAFANRKAKEAEKAVVITDADNQQAFVNKFTQEKLDEWKKQYGNRPLICLSVDGKLAVLRSPLADDLGEYMTAIGTNGMSKAVAMIMEALWIEGDTELIDNEDYFIAVFLQMNKILEGKKADYFRL